LRRLAAYCAGVGICFSFRFKHYHGEAENPGIGEAVWLLEIA
jgi:hypothetical protein